MPLKTWKRRETFTMPTNRESANTVSIRYWQTSRASVYPRDFPFYVADPISSILSRLQPSHTANIFQG
jgi:hypothetical protein